MREIVLSLLSRNGKYECIECVEVNADLSYTGATFWDGEGQVLEYRFLHTDSEIVPSGIVENKTKMLFGGTSNMESFSSERGIVDKVSDYLTTYADLDEWREKKRAHPTKEALTQVLTRLVDSWAAAATSVIPPDNFEIVLVSNTSNAIIVTFKYRGRVQEPIKVYLLTRTAVRERNYGADTAAFKQMIEQICPVVWY